MQNASDVPCATWPWVGHSLCAGKELSTVENVLLSIEDVKTVLCYLCVVCRYKAAVCAGCKDGIVGENNKMITMVTCNGQTYHQQCYSCMVR